MLCYCQQYTSLPACLTGQVTDAGLRALAPLTSLQVLDLHGCFDVTDAGIGALQRLTNLTSLDLSHCIKVRCASSGKVVGCWGGVGGGSIVQGLSMSNMSHEVGHGWALPEDM